MAIRHDWSHAEKEKKDTLGVYNVLFYNDKSWFMWYRIHAAMLYLFDQTLISI